ncbi:hypothetical protein HN51_005137, partial [Arachis hypogaea]
MFHDLQVNFNSRPQIKGGVLSLNGRETNDSPNTIKGKPFVINLVCMPLKNIGTIIEMEWLSKN